MLDFRAPFRAPTMAFFVHGKRGQKSGSRVKLKPLPYMLSLKLFPRCVLDFESCEPGCLVTGLLLGYWVVARLLGQRSSIFSRLSIISAVNWSLFPPFFPAGVLFSSENPGVDFSGHVIREIFPGKVCLIFESGMPRCCYNHTQYYYFRFLASPLGWVTRVVLGGELPPEK